MIENVTAKKEAAAIERGLFLYNGALVQLDYITLL